MMLILIENVPFRSDAHINYSPALIWAKAWPSIKPISVIPGLHPTDLSPNRGTIRAHSAVTAFDSSRHSHASFTSFPFTNSPSYSRPNP